MKGVNEGGKLSFAVDGKQYSASWKEKTTLGKVVSFIGSLFK